jgi:uncharacterized Zn finger protein
MPREDSSEKARRLLAAGRVVVVSIDESAIHAVVRGDSSKLYSVAWRPGSWTCTCQALSRCSHVRATQLVTLDPSSARHLAQAAEVSS